MNTERACPQCGDNAHLYINASARWDAHLNVWVVADVEDCVECTTCDWTGFEDATAVEVVE